ncbi:Uncharacterized protein NEOC65_002262 [Neochlamydia sp. AcF65]|uniref:hypothetical protein n=1 Tax=Neochlamydia sp. AcF65 TaxID=2795735 RepID=UPI001BCA2DDE|nr:hypothetical protein [Neochlamydia sp. AcF65]MBS4167156.1 Uncharacterized protein [Neochlamydia sp. AcF65]
MVSVENSSFTFNDIHEQAGEESFLPALNVIVNKRHTIINNTPSLSIASDLAMNAVEVKGMFTVSF